jgi:hypothetical protein
MIHDVAADEAGAARDECLAGKRHCYPPANMRAQRLDEDVVQHQMAVLDRAVVLDLLCTATSAISLSLPPLKPDEARRPCRRGVRANSAGFDRRSANCRSQRSQ